MSERALATKALKIRALPCKRIAGDILENSRFVFTTNPKFQFDFDRGYVTPVFPELVMDAKWLRSVTEQQRLIVQGVLLPSNGQQEWDILVERECESGESWLISSIDPEAEIRITLVDGDVLLLSVDFMDDLLYLFGRSFPDDNSDIHFP